MVQKESRRRKSRRNILRKGRRKSRRKSRSVKSRRNSRRKSKSRVIKSRSRSRKSRRIKRRTRIQVARKIIRGGGKGPIAKTRRGLGSGSTPAPAVTMVGPRGFRSELLRQGAPVTDEAMAMHWNAPELPHVVGSSRGPQNLYRQLDVTGRKRHAAIGQAVWDGALVKVKSAARAKEEKEEAEAKLVDAVESGNPHTIRAAVVAARAVAVPESSLFRAKAKLLELQREGGVAAAEGAIAAVEKTATANKQASARRNHKILQQSAAWTEARKNRESKVAEGLLEQEHMMGENLARQQAFEKAPLLPLLPIA
jgi:hypothetical protein